MSIENDQKEKISVPEKELEDARPALRAYIARAEARMSTVYRNAGTFIGGAGIIVLIPVFSKDVASDIFDRSARYMFIDGMWPNIFWFVAFVVSFVIPLYSLYLLVKDVVIFHFFGRNLGNKDEDFYPRFSLAALSYPQDEPGKKHVMDIVYNKYAHDFLKPFTPELRRHYDGLRKDHPGIVIVGSDGQERGSDYKPSQPNNNSHDIDRINVAFGLAALEDRILYDEAARIEVSLTRHILKVRTIILRYAKSLLLALFTLIFSIISRNLLKLLEDLNRNLDLSYSITSKAREIYALKYYAFMLDPVILMCFMYIIWGFCAKIMVRQPINWIYRHGQSDPSSYMNIRSDLDLKHFEDIVSFWCHISMASCVFGIIIRLHIVLL